MLRRLFFPLACATLGACIDDEPQEQVKDMRILAIRTTPPGHLYEYLHTLDAQARPALPLPHTTLDVEVLVADPRGRNVEVSIRLCPEERDDACPGYRLRERAPAAQREAMIPLVVPVVRSGTPDLFRGGEVPLPPTTFTFPPAAMDYMVPHDFNGRLSPLAIVNPGLPSFVVRARTADGAQDETAFHRFLLEANLWPSPEVPALEELIDAQLAALLGFERCTDEEEAEADAAWDRYRSTTLDAMTREPEPPQCIRRRQHPANPRLARLLYSFEGEEGDGFGPGGGGGPGGGDSPEARWRRIQSDPTSGGVFKDITAPIVMTPNQSVILRPIVPSVDHQHYQVLEVDSQTGVITASERDEDMAFAWYTTAGQTQRTTSERGGGGGQDSTSTLGPDTPVGPAFVWVIARDQRGGVTWARIEIDVQDLPSSGGGGGGPGGGGPFGP